MEGNGAKTICLSSGEKLIMVPVSRARRASCHQTREDDVFYLKAKQLGLVLVRKRPERGRIYYNIPCGMYSYMPSYKLHNVLY